MTLSKTVRPCILRTLCAVIACSGTAPLAAQPRDAASSLATLPIRACDFSPDAKYLLTTTGRIVQHWDVESGREIQRLEGHRETVHAVRFSHDGRSALTGAGTGGDVPPRDATARLWSLVPAIARKYLVHGTPVLGVQFSPDNKQLLTVNQGAYAWVWDSETGNQLFRRELYVGLYHRDMYIGVLTAASFTPDGKKILGRTRDTTGIRVTIWDAQAGQELAKTPGQPEEIRNAVFSPIGDLILTASRDKTAKTWSTKTGEAVQEFKGHDGTVNSAVFQRDGARIATASADRTARIWNARTGTELHRLDHPGQVNYALISDDGTRILTKWETTLGESPARYHATLWDADSGREIKAFNLRDNSHIAIFAPGGKQILLTLEKTALVDAASGEVTRQFE